MRVQLSITYTNGERASSAHATTEQAVGALVALANVVQVARVKRIELEFDVPK